MVRKTVINSSKISFKSRNTARLYSHKVQVNVRQYELCIRTMYSLISVGTEKLQLLGKIHNRGSEVFPYTPNATIVGRVIEAGCAAKKVRPELLNAIVLLKGRHQSITIVDALTCELVLLPHTIPPKLFLVSRYINIANEAVIKARLDVNHRVAIFGLGSLGIVLAMVCKQILDSPILGYDKEPKRVKTASSLQLIEPLRTTDFEKMYQSFDVIFVCCSSRNALYRSFDLLKDEGSIILIGASTEPYLADIGQHIFRRNINLVGCHERFSSASRENSCLNNGAELLKKKISSYSKLTVNEVRPIEALDLYNVGLLPGSIDILTAIDWQQIEGV